MNWHESVISFHWREPLEPWIDTVQETRDIHLLVHWLVTMMPSGSKYHRCICHRRIVSIELSSKAGTTLKISAVIYIYVSLCVTSSILFIRRTHIYLLNEIFYFPTQSCGIQNRLEIIRCKSRVKWSNAKKKHLYRSISFSVMTEQYLQSMTLYL